jgi:hypothetical protein
LDEEEQRVCQEIEDTLHEVEVERISALKDAGYELWFGNVAGYDFEGNVKSWGSNFRPDFSLFDGYLLRIAANQHVPKEQVPAVLAQVLTELAAELGSDKPVHLMVGGPPITGFTISDYCESDICAADFGPAFDQVEAWLVAALDSFAPGQVTRFSSALFDGAHYDILDPYEDVDGLRLNRAAETGYNSPILNIYRAK